MAKRISQAKPNHQETEKAFFFRLRLTDGTVPDIEDILRKFTGRAARNSPRLLDFEHQGNLFQFCEPNWDDSDDLRVFSGTILKADPGPLPPAVEKGVPAEPLGLADNKRLGETMCFAYEPEAGVAIVFHSSRGPRPSIIPVLFRELKFSHEVTCTHICWDDIMERLERMGVAQTFEIGIKNVSDAEELRVAGASVEKVIDMGQSVGGRNVHFRVTIDRGKEAFALKTLASTIRKLRDIGVTKLSQLKLKAAESEESVSQVLDFIKARIQSEVAITRDGRTLDRSKCQKELVRSLKEVLPVIKDQKHS
jgi:hypothetical protein